MSNLPPPVKYQTTELPNIVKNTSEYIGNAGQTIGKGYNDLKDNVTNTLSQFSDKAVAGAGASQQFLNSNTIIAKFAFVVLIIILFVYLLALGLSFMQYLLSPGNNPYLVKGMISGTTGVVITQDPTNKKSVTLRRSNNQKTGIEFTWSVWLYISDVNNVTSCSQTNNTATYQNVFNKGTSDWSTNVAHLGIATTNNGPGLYLGFKSGVASLRVVMNTMNSDGSNSAGQDAIVDVPNIPLKKWINVIVRMENVMLDVYINGVITERAILSNVPKQNYDDVHVCGNGGFNGNLSNLRYFDRALSVIQINNIVFWGPNTSAPPMLSTTRGGYDYLSSTWYTGLSL